MTVHISGLIVAYKTGSYNTKEIVEFMLIISILFYICTVLAATVSIFKLIHKPP